MFEIIPAVHPFHPPKQQPNNNTVAAYLHHCIHFWLTLLDVWNLQAQKDGDSLGVSSHPIWGIPLRAFLDLKFHSHPSGSTYRAILSPHCWFARLDRGGAAASSILKPRMNLETKVHQRSKHKQTPAQCRAPGTLQQGQGTTPHRTIRTSGTPSSL